MFFAGKLALGVVTGGMLLGAGLAGMVKPVPKAGPEAPWASAIQPYAAAAPGYDYIEPLPEDLSPGDQPGGYPPPFAMTELAELWQADFEMPDYPLYAPEPLPEVSLAEPSPPSEFAALGEWTVTAPHQAAHSAAEAAQDTADAAVSATPEPGAQAVPEPAPTGQARMIRIPEAGPGDLY